MVRATAEKTIADCFVINISWNVVNSVTGVRAVRVRSHSTRRTAQKERNLLCKYSVAGHSIEHIKWRERNDHAQISQVCFVFHSAALAAVASANRNDQIHTPTVSTHGRQGMLLQLQIIYANPKDGIFYISYKIYVGTRSDLNVIFYRATDD